MPLAPSFLNIYENGYQLWVLRTQGYDYRARIPELLHARIPEEQQEPEYTWLLGWNCVRTVSIHLELGNLMIQVSYVSSQVSAR